MTTLSTTESPPWHAHLPTPQKTPSKITKEEVLTLLTNPSTSEKKFLLIDVRRNDHHGLTIKGSLNLPAQSLYESLETLYGLVKQAGVRRVIWYCGSSNGRGPRTAGWFADYLMGEGDGEVESLVLEGGIKGWIRGGEKFRALLIGNGRVEDVLG